MGGPLEGFRVIDVCRYGPGRWASGLLSDYGADVISVIEPGFSGRSSGQMSKGPVRVPSTPRNRRSLFLNLRAEGAKDVFYRLVKMSHAVLESNRPGVAQRLGVDYESVRVVKPDIVYCSLAGYGQDGPYRLLAGHDINYQAIGGMVPQGRDGRPVIPHYNDSDNNVAWNGTIALLMGLLHHTRTGQGQFIDVAFSDSAIRLPPGGEVRGDYPAYNIYECKDGEYISLGTIEPWFWERLCQVMGREDLTPHQRPEGDLGKEVMAYFRETFKTKTQAEWFKFLSEADMEVAPIHRTTKAVVNDPHNRARSIILEVEDQATGEKHPQAGFALKFSDTPATLRWGTTPEGGHTREVLGELGYSDTEVAQLAEEGITRLVN